VRTGNGWHLWFHPTGFGNRVHLLPGLDWRGAGGYVVAPPSVHATGGDYRWVRRPGGSLPVAPPALLGLIEGPAASGAHRPIAHPGRYAQAALAAEADRVARAPVGSRNDTLNRAAFALGRLVGAGLLDTAGVTGELEAAAWSAGLGRAETRRTIRSGLTAGQRAPIATDQQGANDGSQRRPVDRTHTLPADRSRGLPTDSNQSLPTDSRHGLPTGRDRGAPGKRVQHGRIDGGAGGPIDNDHGVPSERDRPGPIESDPGRRVA
jgi:hypothetical protein